MSATKKSKSASRREKIQKDEEPKPLTKKELSETVKKIELVAKRKKNGVVIVIVDELPDERTASAFGGKGTKTSDVIDMLCDLIIGRGINPMLFSIRLMEHAANPKKVS